MDDVLSTFQFEINAEIQSFQVRPDGKVWFHSLGDWFQEVAWRHANSGGFGTEIQNSNLMWALSRLEIRSHNLPVWGDKFRLLTAGRGVNKIFAFREFLMVNENDQKLVEGMSSWLLLDSKSKRPQPPEKVLPVHLFDPQLKPLWEPSRIKLSESKPLQEIVHVSPSDLDLYDHVNNTSYIRWAENLLFEEKGSPSSCLINFLSESHLGDKLNFSYAKDDNFTCISGSSGGANIFSSLWK